MDTTTNETTGLSWSDAIAKLDADIRAHGTMGPDELSRARAALASLAGTLDRRTVTREEALRAYRPTVDGFDSGVVYVGLCQDVADRLANGDDVADEIDDLREALRAEGFGQREYAVQIVHHVRIMTFRTVTASDEDTAADLAYDEVVASPDFTVSGMDVDDWELLDSEVERVDEAS